jgi:hypothetical protein
MNFSRSIAWGSCVAATVVLASVASPAFGQTRPASTAGPLIDSTHPLMQVEEVALKGNTNVFGDPSKPGMYVYRMRLNANQTARPHYDDQDRWVTVLQGTLWLGKGDVFRPDKLVQLRQGGVAYLAANTHYYEMAGDGEVILQITGNGPVRSVHSEVDEKGQPVPEGGPYPVFAAAKRRNMPIDPDLIDPDTQDAMDRAAAAKKAAAQAQAKPPAATTPAATTAPEPKK